MKKARFTAIILILALVLTMMLPVCAYAQEGCEHVPGAAEITPAGIGTDGRRTVQCELCDEKYIDEDIPAISAIKLTKTSFTYNGKAQAPGVSATDASGQAISPESYTVSYSNPASKLPGKYSVTVTFTGELYTGEAALSYTIIPAKVSGLKFSALSTTSVKVSWAKAVGAEKYEVYNATTKKRIGIVSGTSITIKKLTTGKSYSIKVRAYDTDTKKYGAYSALTVNTLKTAIKNASVTAKSITLTWAKAAGASGYYVYRRSGTSGAWKKLATVKGGSNVKYTDKVSGAYYYCVKAYKTSGKKNVPALTSAAVRLRTLKTPVAVADTSSDPAKVALSWNSVSGATGYMIQRRAANSEGKWLDSWTNVATVGKITDCTLPISHGKYYKFRVRAIYKSNGVTSYGAYSDVTTGIISYLTPNISISMSAKKNTACKKIPVKVTNNGKYTMRFYSKGAIFMNSDYSKYDRDLTLVDKNGAKKSYIDIKPGKTATLYFAVNGSKTTYLNTSHVVCLAKYDGVYYYTFFSNYYGLFWVNEFEQNNANV